RRTVAAKCCGNHVSSSAGSGTPRARDWPCRCMKRRQPRSDMPDLNSDLHGSAPDKSAVALMIIHMINDLEFDGGERLEQRALEAARRTAALKTRCQEAGVPVIYANDNFGRWRSDFRQVVDRVLHDGVRGQPLAELLEPAGNDYFVLKPKHSAFFETTLETLLRYLGVRRLILTGITGDICVKLTAND